MTPTSTIVLIRPFLILFSANALLLIFSGLRRSHSILKPCCLSHSDCQVGAFSVVRPSENWENWFLAKVPDSMPSLQRLACFTCLNGLIFLIFCSKQELCTLLPNPLLSSAQRTHHSMLDALSAGLVVPLDVVLEVVRAFELPLAR